MLGLVIISYDESFIIHDSKAVPVLNCLKALCHEDIWGNGVIAPPFLSSTLGEGELLASALPLYNRWSSIRYPLDRMLGGPQSRSGRCGEEENLALPWMHLFLDVFKGYIKISLLTARCKDLREGKAAKYCSPRSNNLLTQFRKRSSNSTSSCSLSLQPILLSSSHSGLGLPSCLPMIYFKQSAVYLFSQCVL
jgi:hypothetical protein